MVGMIGIVRDGKCASSILFCSLPFSRYDYTGLSKEESLGLGWKTPFHPDDMSSTGRKWTHSLGTGDPYSTEYRCRSKHGEWRWMLGRALPMRNKITGEIEKWFGTCTDVHEAVESRFAARRTVRAISCRNVRMLTGV